MNGASIRGCTLYRLPVLQMSSKEEARVHLFCSVST